MTLWVIEYVTMLPSYKVAHLSMQIKNEQHTTKYLFPGKNISQSTCMSPASVDL